jgi:hypothetical protein
MLDYLGGCQRTEPGRVTVVLPTRHSDQEAGREQIAGAGYIDNVLNGRSIHGFKSIAADDHATLGASRHHRELRVLLQGFGRSLEIGGLIEAVQFMLVGEDQIDRPLLDEVEKFGAVTIDAK